VSGSEKSRSEEAADPRTLVLEAAERLCAERGLAAVSISIPLIVAGILVMRYKV